MKALSTYSVQLLNKTPPYQPIDIQAPDAAHALAEAKRLYRGVRSVTELSSNSTKQGRPHASI
jgi:hypothetical protein